LHEQRQSTHLLLAILNPRDAALERQRSNGDNMKTRDLTAVLLKLMGLDLTLQSLHYFQTMVLAWYANHIGHQMASVTTGVPSYPWWVPILPIVLLVGAGIALILNSAKISVWFVREEWDLHLTAISSTDVMTIGVALIGLYFGAAGLPRFLDHAFAVQYADALVGQGSPSEAGRLARLRLLSDVFQIGISVVLFIKARAIATLVKRPDQNTNKSAERTDPPCPEPASRSPQG
jgi:hypothetical protein